MDLTKFPTKTALFHQIDTLKEITRQQHMAYDRLQKRDRELREQIREFLISTDTNFSDIIVYSMMFDCFTAHWDPKFELAFPQSSGIYFIGDRFVRSNSGHKTIYSRDVIDAPLPFDGQKLLNVCEHLTKILGIFVGFKTTSFYEVD